jgi:hypothetical protein
LNSRALTEHFDVSAITGVEERRTIDPVWHREAIVYLEAQPLGVELDGRVKVHSADRNVMEPWSGARAVHHLPTSNEKAGGTLAPPASIISTG